jgi:O-antigen/teichoic acid export membrane protein
MAAAAVSTDSSKHADDAHHAARSGAVQVLTILAQLAIMLTSVVFARLYGPIVFGAYTATMMGFVEIAARGGAAGAPSAMLRYVAAARAVGDEEGVRRALGSALRLCLSIAGPISLLMGLGVVAWLPWINPVQAPALRLMAPVPVLYGCLWILIQASLAARVTRANFWVRGVFEPWALLGAGVIAWALGAGLAGLALAHALSATATFLVALAVVRHVFRPGERRRVLSAPGIPGFARFSLLLGLGDFLNAVLQRADVLIVSTFLGTEALAAYTASELITRVVANTRYAFDSIVAGMMSEALHLGALDRATYNLRLTTRWVVSVAAPIAAAVIVMRRDLLGLFGAGSTYVAGAPALAVLAVSHFISASLGLTGWALVAGGRSRLVMLNNALGVAVNITLGVILTPRFGLVGTACAVLAATLVAQGSAVIEVATGQRLNAFSRALWKPLAAGALAFLAMTAVHEVIPFRWLRIAAVILTGVLVDGGLLLLLGLPAEERQMLERLRAKRS